MPAHALKLKTFRHQFIVVVVFSLLFSSCFPLYIGLLPPWITYISHVSATHYGSNLKFTYLKLSHSIWLDYDAVYLLLYAILISVLLFFTYYIYDHREMKQRQPVESNITDRIGSNTIWRFLYNAVFGTTEDANGTLWMLHSKCCGRSNWLGGN